MSKHFELVICVLSYYLTFMFVTLCVLFYYVCIAVLHTSVAGLLARSLYPKGLTTRTLAQGFLDFPVPKSKC